MSGRSTRWRFIPALEAGDYSRAMELIAVMAGFEEIRAEEQNGTNVTVVKARSSNASARIADQPGRRLHGL